MSITHTCKRVNDTQCTTCGKIAPVIEHRTITKGYFYGVGDQTVTMVDREVHCEGHLDITRSVTKTLDKRF